jgi:hypothetical protein
LKPPSAGTTLDPSRPVFAGLNTQHLETKKEISKMEIMCTIRHIFGMLAITTLKESWVAPQSEKAGLGLQDPT